MTRTIERMPFVDVKKHEGFRETESGSGGGRRRGGGREPWDRQPVGPPPGGSDRSLLTWILLTIEDELFRFVHGREKSFPGAWRRDFRAVWPKMTACFESAHSSLEWGSDTLQGKLGRAGLGGAMLSLKAERLSSYVNVFRESLGELSITNPQSRSSGPVEKIKDLVFGAINSILGSLSMAFPVLEAVKEYKEHVELSVKAVELGVAE